MRVYDLALAFVRALVAMDFIRGGIDIVYTAIRYMFLIPSAGGSEWLTKVEMSSWLSPVYSLVTAAVLLAASRRIAAFAAKFAGSIDAASHF